MNIAFTYNWPLCPLFRKVHYCMFIAIILMNTILCVLIFYMFLFMLHI